MMEVEVVTMQAAGIQVALTPREMELLRGAADFAGYGCSIAAIRVEPPVDFSELEELRDRIDEVLASGEPLFLTQRELEVAHGLLSYQELQCPVESWCEVDGASQEELDAIREKLAALLA